MDLVDIIGRIKGASETLIKGGEEGNHNRWEAAIGVGYSAAGGGLSFNLMRDSQQVHGAVRSVVAHLMFSACLALLFLLGGAWYYHEGRLRNEAVIEAAKNEIALLEEEIEAMSSEGLGDDVEYAVFGDPSLLDLLKEINQRIPAESAIVTEIRVSPPGARTPWLDISGSTGSAAEFEAAFEGLKASDTFILDENAEPRLQGERTTFRIRAYRSQEEKDAL